MDTEQGAPQTDAPLTISSGAEAILGLMNNDRAAVEGDDTPPAQTDTPTGDNAGPEETPATSDDTAQAEPEETPAIEPPVSWASEDKETFSKLPVDLQKRIAEREAERERLISQSQREAAEKAKTFESELSKTSQERQQFAQQLQTLIPQLQTAIQGKWAQVDWNNLAKTDQATYVALQHEFRIDMARLQQAQAAQAQLKQQETEQAEKAKQEAGRKEWEALITKRPELKDQTKAKAFFDDITAYAKESGFPPDRFAQAVSHVELLTLEKAMKYDRAQRAKVQAADKAKTVPKVQKPGADNAGKGTDKAAEAEAAMNRLRKSGSINDAAMAMRRLGFV